MKERAHLLIPIAIFASLFGGICFGYYSGITAKNANAQTSPANPDDIRGIRLAAEEIAKNTKKMSECKK